MRRNLLCFEWHQRGCRSCANDGSPHRTDAQDCSGTRVVLRLLLPVPAVQAAAVESGIPAPAPDITTLLSAPLLERHSSASSLTDMVVIPTSPVGAVLPTALDLRVLQPLKCLPNCPAWANMGLRMLLPVLVLVVGLGFSIAALSVAVSEWRS